MTARILIVLLLATNLAGCSFFGGNHTQLANATPSLGPHLPPVMLEGSTQRFLENNVPHLLGEVHNNAADRLGNIRVTIRFIDAAGKDTAVTVSPIRNILEPGDRSAFDVEIPTGAVNQTLTFSSEPTTARLLNAPTDLNVTRVDPVPGPNGTFELHGTIVNQAPQAGQNLRVFLVYYDTQGELVAIRQASTTKTILDPGESTDAVTPFDPALHAASFHLEASATTS